MAATPRDVLLVAKAKEQLELLGEQLVVVGEVVAEEWKGLDEGAAARHDLGAAARERSSVANCWKTRTGSSELITLTALVRAIRDVRSAMAASAMAGAETAKSGRWCSPIPKTSRPTWSASTASSIRFRSLRSGEAPARRIRRELRERVEAEFHNP